MIAIGVLFGLLGGVVGTLIVVLLRRRNSGTHNADGLRIEQTRRLQARDDRVSFNALTLHGQAPNMTDQYRHH
ncbi:hypothetical protein AB0E88_15885 [Streptomyces sp. NPDC028635]|uniref:hypothetical protein n=1 Tax=Streptomyces sp. NPDC028635 TaxID=3154800 RepID=UPI0033D479DB